MKSIKYLSVIILLVLFTANLSAQTRVEIGPRVTGNFNIYNQKGLTGTWNGLGIGMGANVDVSFSPHIGMMVYLTAFDMKNFSNSQTNNNVITETSLSLSYLTLDPMFKAEFSGFYMVAGPSIGIKLNSSGEVTQTATGQTPAVNNRDFDTNSIRFDIAAGTGYTFRLSQDIGLGTDLIAYIPLTDTYNFPGLSNSIFSLKLGASLKFRL